jgi:hypothetical protein
MRARAFEFTPWDSWVKPILRDVRYQLRYLEAGLWAFGKLAVKERAGLMAGP